MDMPDKVSESGRESNIELLRIVSIMGVIILHYNNAGIGGGGAQYVVNYSLNYWILIILEYLFIGSVDLFVIISGYFMCNSDQREMTKPLSLLIQTVIFSAITYILKVFEGGIVFSAEGMAGALLPCNYFVILYIVLYLISPFVNILIKSLDESHFTYFMRLCIFLFAVCPSAVDILTQITHKEWMGLSTVGMYGSQYGYSVVNFILMYLIGAYVRFKEYEFSKVSKLKLLTLLGCILVVLIIWGNINPLTAQEYCNPVVIFESVTIFLLFKRMHFGEIKWLNKVAEGTFTVFLLHLVFLEKFDIKKAVTGNWMWMILHILGVVIFIYFICWCIFLAYKCIMDGKTVRLLKGKILRMTVGRYKNSSSDNW